MAAERDDQLLPPSRANSDQSIALGLPCVRILIADLKLRVTGMDGV
ncbi:hypothetical protein [Nocardia sp. NPDC057272]